MAFSVYKFFWEVLVVVLFHSNLSICVSINAPAPFVHYDVDHLEVGIEFNNKGSVTFLPANNTLSSGEY